MSTDPVGDAGPVIERVRKLLAKAERTDHPHEAEAFAAKAAELIAAHRLTPAALAAARDGGRLRLLEVALGRGAYVRARLRLLTVVAEAHDADVVFQSGGAGMTAFVAGFDEDLVAVEVLFGSLHRQAAGQMAAERRRTAAATQRWRRAFLFGFAERAGELLRAVRTRHEATTASTHADGGAALALAVRARRDRVTDFTARSFPRVTTASRAAPASARGWSDGRAAAEQADLGRSRLAGRRALGRGGRPG